MSAGAAYAPWALRTRIDQQVVGLHDRFQAPPFERGEWYLAYGNGRSYGDSCLNIGHHIVPMRSLDRMMDFDAGSGVLTCEAGVTLDSVPDLSLAALRAVQAALDEIEGWARYRVEGLAEDGSPTDDTRHFIEKRGGISAKLASRAEGGAPLKGTKRGVVAGRRHFVGIGTKDGRSLVIVPLLDARVHCTAIVLACLPRSCSPPSRSLRYSWE